MVKDLKTYAVSKENSKIRAEMWGEFVGWDNRRRGENGFIDNVLRDHNSHRILDTASGDGADAIYLAGKGFDVSANEVDSAFLDKTIENVDRVGLKISLSNLDWRELSQSYNLASKDALFCLGNSLACLSGRENQIEALR